jgi:hypothetical protein
VIIFGIRQVWVSVFVQAFVDPLNLFLVVFVTNVTVGRIYISETTSGVQDLDPSFGNSSQESNSTNNCSDQE